MSKHPPLYAWNNYHCTKTGTADSLKQELLDYGFSTMPIESTTTGVFKVTTTIKPSFAPVAADVNSLVGLKAYKYYGPTTTYESSTISEAVLAEMSIVEIPNPCKVKLAYVELLSHSNSSYSYKYILNTASVISFVREGPINSDYTDTFYLKLFPESTSYVYKFLRQDISTKRVVTQTYNLSFTKATIGYSATLTLDDPYASNIIVLGVNGQQFKTYAATAVSGRTITISAADPISSSSYAIADIITIGYKCDSTSLFYRGEQYYNNGVEVVYIHNGLYHLEDNDLFAGALLTTSNNTDVITPSANWTSDSARITQQYPFFSHSKYRIEGEANPRLLLKTQTGYVSPKTVAGTSSVTQPQQLLYNDRLVIRDDTYYPVGALPSSQTVEIKDDHLYIDGVDTLYLAGRNVYIGEVINSVFLEKSISPLQLHKSKRNVKVKDELYKEDLGFGIEYSGGDAPTSQSGGYLGLYYSTLYASPLRTINLSNAYKYTDSQFLSWKLQANHLITLSPDQDISLDSGLEKVDSMWIPSDLTMILNFLPTEIPEYKSQQKLDPRSSFTKSDVAWNSSTPTGGYGDYQMFTQSVAWKYPIIVNITVSNWKHMGYTEVVQMTVPFTSNTTDFSVSIATTNSAYPTTTTTYLWQTQCLLQSNLPILDFQLLSDSGVLHLLSGKQVIVYDADIQCTSDTTPTYLFAVVVAA